MLTAEDEFIRADLADWVARYGRDRSALLPVLQETQDRYRCVSPLAMQVVGRHFGMQPAEVYGVVSFHPYLSMKPVGRHVVRLCRGLCCDLAGKRAVAQQLESTLAIRFGETTPDGEFTLAWADCLGVCDQGPGLLVDGRIHTRVAPCRVSGIIAALRRGAPDALEGPAVPVSRAAHVSLPHIEPGDGLRAALARTPAEVAPVVAAGLRLGRWAEAVSAVGRASFVVCNGDADGPCSFTERVLLAEHADLVAEGMTVAAYATGAPRGIVYLRGELAYLRVSLDACLEARRRQGLLGGAILGRTGFGFDIEVRPGAGMRVGADDGALIAFLEGFRAEPRSLTSPVGDGRQAARYVVGTAEALARIPGALAGGADRREATAARLCSVSGDCTRPGVYEFPPGASIAQVLAEAGGMAAAAVQVGGPSGRLVRAADFGQTLAGAAAGPVVVLSHNRDLLRVARQGLELAGRQSCGQCVPCREGIPRLLDGVERLARRSCSDFYLSELCSLAKSMRVAARCSIGRSAPDAFLSVVAPQRSE